MAVSAIFRKDKGPHEPSSRILIERLLKDLGPAYMFDAKLEVPETFFVAVSSGDEDYQDLENKLECLIEQEEAVQAVSRDWYRPFLIYSDGDSAGVAMERLPMYIAGSILESKRLYDPK